MAIVLGPHPELGCRAVSVERQSEQARAQQHKAGRSQREEAVGHEVMVTHGAPVALDAGPNSLKISESAFLQKRYCCGRRRDQALDRKPSNAWARKMPALTRPKKAVTVSIIATVHWPRLRQNDRRVAQSKEFRGKIENRVRLMIWCNSLVGRKPKIYGNCNRNGSLGHRLTSH
jgi:hypothetical protein